MFQRYFIKYSFESLHIVVAKFSAETKITMSESKGRRYIQRLKMNCYLAAEKPFVSMKNISAVTD